MYSEAVYMSSRMAKTVFLVLLILRPDMESSVGGVSGASVASERRLSSRVVTTKYGALRGFVVTLPNRNLRAVEVFLGTSTISFSPLLHM